MEKLLQTILIIDDNKKMYEDFKENINSNTINIKFVNSIDILKAKLAIDGLTLIIIDTDISFIKGIDILKDIRNKSNVPIIIITYIDSIFDKILAFNMGTDDYLVKPFDMRELIVRAKAIIKRYNVKERKSNINNVNLKNLKIDFDSYKVIYKNKELKMPPKEFELLYYLVINNNKVFTRDELLYKVWGYNYSGDSRTVDVHIKRLRTKLGNNSEWSLSTVWGIGYKFEIKNIT